jgi:hypothetical protein
MGVQYVVIISRQDVTVATTAAFLSCVVATTINDTLMQAAALQEFIP